MEENKLISYEMFFKKTLIVETLFHEEKKMISLRFQSKAPAKYQEFFFSPYTLFNPLNAYIPTDLTFPPPPNSHSPRLRLQCTSPSSYSF